MAQTRSQKRKSNNNKKQETAKQKPKKTNNGSKQESKTKVKPNKTQQETIQTRSRNKKSNETKETAEKSKSKTNGNETKPKRKRGTKNKKKKKPKRNEVIPEDNKCRINSRSRHVDSCLPMVLIREILKKEGKQAYSKIHRNREGLINTLHTILDGQSEYDYVLKESCNTWKIGKQKKIYDWMSYFKVGTPRFSNNEWISTEDINTVLNHVTKPNWSYYQFNQQYSSTYDEKKWLGWTTFQIWLGDLSNVSEERKPKYVKKFGRKNRCGILIISENHFTCLYVDRKKKTAFYFDSYAKDPRNSENKQQIRISNFITKVLQKCKIDQKNLEVNTKKMQTGSCECGVFVIYALRQLAMRKPINFKLKDNDMKKLRNTYMFYQKENQNSPRRQRKQKYKKDDNGVIHLD